MQPPITQLNKGQTFCFSCSPQVACFNACCRDLNQVLTPFDVLCLKQFLKLTSGDFLDRYTQANTGPETGMPVVSLRFGDATDLACPFVDEAGCRVYPARPASCRTYPLARGVCRNRKNGRLTERWGLIRESHCLGFRHARTQTVDDWVADQQIAEHNRMNDRMLELISLKNRLRPEPLTPFEQKRLYGCLYDLDGFRVDLLAKKYQLPTTIDPRALDRARSNDRDLLLVGMVWAQDFLLRPSTRRHPNPEKLNRPRGINK